MSTKDIVRDYFTTLGVLTLLHRMSKPSCKWLVVWVFGNWGRGGEVESSDLLPRFDQGYCAQEKFLTYEERLDTISYSGVIVRNWKLFALQKRKMMTHTVGERKLTK